MENFDWAVGVFEGEGCIGISYPPDRPNPRVSLVVNMTDEDVVKRVHKSFKLGTVVGPKSNGIGRKDSYVWKITKRNEVELLLNKMIPLLGSRRRTKARKALKVLEALKEQ